MVPCAAIHQCFKNISKKLIIFITKIYKAIYIYNVKKKNLFTIIIYLLHLLILIKYHILYFYNIYIYINIYIYGFINFLNKNNKINVDATDVIIDIKMDISRFFNSHTGLYLGKNVYVKYLGDLIVYCFNKG